MPRSPPLRDVFATVFFVSIGMLLDPRFVVDNWAAIAVVIAALLVGKFAICSVVPLLFRYPAKVALFTGLALVQMGEFSFVLARVGVETATLSEYHYSLALTAAIATMVLTPWLMQIGPPLYAFVAGLPLLGALVKELEPAPTEDISALSNHVVICGYGDVGRTLAQVLEGRGLKYLAIDYDPHAIMDLRRRGIPAIYGDAANRNVLAHANLPKARVLAVTLAEPTSGELAVQNARAINPRLDIIARAANLPAQGALRSAGAVEVVEPRFEAAAEIVRHTLHRYGLTTAEIQLLINHLREARYQGKEGDGT